MATLRANGTQVLRIRDDIGRDRRIMSNGVVLRSKPTGGFVKAGRFSKSTFRRVWEQCLERGWVVDLLAPEWLDLRPSPVRRLKHGHVDPGLDRAQRR